MPGMLGRARGGPSEGGSAAGALTGQPLRFEEVYLREFPRVFALAYALSGSHWAAEDIAQDAFLAAVDALDRFDRRRPFGPWLHRVVINRAIDWARREALRRGADEAGDELPAPAPAEQLGEEMIAALAALSAEQRAVVVLRYLLDYTPGEMSRMLELPRGTVNSRLRRGLDRLEAILDKEHA